METGLRLLVAAQVPVEDYAPVVPRLGPGRGQANGFVNRRQSLGGAAHGAKSETPAVFGGRIGGTQGVGPVQAGQGLVVTPQALQDGRPIDPARGEGRLHRQGLVDGPQRLVQPTQPQQDQGAVVHALEGRPAQAKRLVVADQRLVVPTELVQDPAARGVEVGIVRLQGQGPVVAGQGFGQAPEETQGHGSELRRRLQ